MSSRIIRLGLVGAGQWGRVYLKTILTLEGVELRWLASSNPESPRLVGGKCRITDNWRELVGATDLDGIIVATPPAVHAEITESAVKSGLGVLVEKPLSLSLQEAKAILELAVQSNILVMVDHIHLFNPAYRKLKEIVCSSGPINYISTASGNMGPFRKDTSVLWDWGPHDVSMCLDLLGATPVEVNAKRLECKENDKGLGETLSLQLIFEKGIKAEIIIGNMLPEKKRIFEVRCENKVLVFDDFAKEKIRVFSLSHGKLGSSESVEVDPVLPLTVVVNEFTEALRQRAVSLENLKLSVEVVRTLSLLESKLVSHL